MRIFVSSSFEDLREHRAAAIRVLRQLGHEVLAMEDMIAGSVAPLAKVLEMVDRCEAYVGIFAWRYGYVPGRVAESLQTAMGTIPPVQGAHYGKTSITHYEYLRAVQRELPVMAFLLDEQCSWPPQLIDGFDTTTRADAPATADDIRALRQVLQQERVVSWFTTPTDFEARVSAAVTMAGLTRQLDLQPATALDPNTGVAGDSSAEIGITQAIVAAGDHQRALKIDIRTTWWSTRLYLIAVLADRLTQARRILVVDTTPAETTGETVVQSPTLQAIEERFVGQLSTRAILTTIGPRLPALGIFAQWLQARPIGYNEVHAEIRDLLDGWRNAFADAQGMHVNERAAKVDLTAELLRRWFGDAMLQLPMHIADLQRASVVDLLRLLDYPSDYVPVLTRHAPAAEGQSASERVDVVDKGALNGRLARSYLVELMDRARIV
ncbi:DUF4062 domain-containing protein [Variovorax sp. J31P179]|uniref:DUF4062 domain-containing protein n=1 Tax=Variovorax sp. J31P179 TaxID=3053508 RepID=UPI002575DF39|nr:DUF4062 domain-containing protein [Variovorax sp. J31P179]MDM0084569.1 DUF4062 domain-containing protein [Variovorax sp. J31P179]